MQKKELVDSLKEEETEKDLQNLLIDNKIGYSTMKRIYAKLMEEIVRDENS